jgi:DNA sulfur modification protein DndC
LTAPDPPAPADLSERVEAIVEQMAREYKRPDRKVWIVGFSAGKDSTLTLHLLLEAMLRMPPSQRRRPVVVACNDTLVESPVMAAFVSRTLARVRDAAEGLGLPVRVLQTAPALDQTFWVNLIGRGYPAPSSSMRWCTDRMKIRPTAAAMKAEVEAAGGGVLLIGVRRSESDARARTVAAHDNGELMHPHGSMPGVLVYRPIVDLSTEDVWTALMQMRPPWGGTHRDLVTLYRNALGGECPFVVDNDDAPSCGNNPSSRFGCWVCTVVEKDRSLEGLIASGFENLEPLAEFRDWLKAYSRDLGNRLGERRDGTDGHGPFSMEARAEILRRVRELERETGLEIVSADEEAMIRRQWTDDELVRAARRVVAPESARQIERELGSVRKHLAVLHEGKGR